MTRSTLRWGLLGTARINDRILDAVSSSRRSRVVAVASRNAERAAAYAAARDIATPFGSYEDLIASDQIDLVYVSLPNDLHTPWAIQAAQAGKHVLVEKPIALTSDDVKSLISEATRQGVLIQEASMMRLHEQTALIRRIISEGTIGVPRWARGSFSFSLNNPGDIRTNKDGGGSLWDLGSYPVTLFQAALQALPLEVAGFMHRGPEAVDMTFSGQIRYEGDVLGQLVTSMEALPSWSAEIAGSDGYLRISYPWLSHLGVTSTVDVVTRLPEGGPRATFGDGVDDQITTSHLFENVNAYVDEVAAVEALILDGAVSAYPLTESAINVATIEALIQSATSGRTVAVAI
ncbi:MAG: Gfo/Idh/MocA family protein [Acidimicrobiia bacterium]